MESRQILRSLGRLTCFPRLRTEIGIQVSILNEHLERSKEKGFCSRNKRTVSECLSTRVSPQEEREEEMRERWGEKALLEESWKLSDERHLVGQQYSQDPWAKEKGFNRITLSNTVKTTP